MPNQDGALLPGMYVQAKFSVVRDRPPLIIPSPALIVNAQGTQVAVVKDDKIAFQKVQIGEDYGNTLEIVGGLEGNEKIISTPGEKIVEGAMVKIVSAEGAGARLRRSQGRKSRRSSQMNVVRRLPVFALVKPRVSR